MNTQDISQEQWTTWKPLENLPTKCWVDIVNVTPDHLIILLNNEDEKENCTISLKFTNNFSMYKVTDEMCTINLLYEIIYAYGKPFVYGSAFFLINNSSYIEWLVEKSNGSLQADTLHHYCIFGVNRVVDVISSEEPEVIITYNDPGLSKD